MYKGEILVKKSNGAINVNSGFLERTFKLSQSNTTIKTEIIAGITTFLTMAYIIAVNPDFLSQTGMDKGAVLTATCLTTGLTTIFMGIYANLPFSLASGMGLNAFFAFTVCGAMKVPWQIALTAVFLEGIVFIILSLTKVREIVVNSIPTSLKIAVSAGIGLFIAFIGFQNAGIVINDNATLVTLGTFKDPRAVISIIGVIIIGILVHKKVKGAMLWGILSCTIISWTYALIIGPEKAAEAYKIFLPTGLFGIHSIAPIAGKLDFSIFATAPALIIVGLFMMQNITIIDFYNYTEAIPVFLTIILMPLTYSIATGLMFGVISYVLFNFFCGKKENVSITLIILAIIFIIRLISI